MRFNVSIQITKLRFLAAEDLGDPTDATTGWALCFKKQKTGPLPFNVEYTLQVLKCKPEPLTEEQLEAIKELPNIDDVITRPTSDLQKEFIESRVLETTPAGNIPEDVAKEVSELL